MDAVAKLEARIHYQKIKIQLLINTKDMFLRSWEGGTWI